PGKSPAIAPRSNRQTQIAPRGEAGALVCPPHLRRPARPSGPAPASKRELPLARAHSGSRRWGSVSTFALPLWASGTPLTIEPLLSSRFSMAVRPRLDFGANRDRHATLARRSSILQVCYRQQARGPWGVLLAP